MATVPAPFSQSTSRSSGWRRPAALGLLAVLVAALSGVVTYYVRGDDAKSSGGRSLAKVVRHDTRRSDPIGSTTTSTSTSTSTTTTTAPLVPPAAPGFPAQVARTCGSTGRGDCFVSVRTGPSGTSPEVARMIDGQSFAVVCQVQGEGVFSSVLNATSSAWSRTPGGTYVASIYVNAAGFDPLRVSVPCP